MKLSALLFVCLSCAYSQHESVTLTSCVYSGSNAFG
jgi:hypothetical protein